MSRNAHVHTYVVNLITGFVHNAVLVLLSIIRSCDHILRNAHVHTL